jgi:hypothetical protein
LRISEGRKRLFVRRKPTFSAGKRDGMPLP